SRHQVDAEAAATMATLGVRSRSLKRSLAHTIWLYDTVWANVRAPLRTLLHLDKLGVTGSSPVRPPPARSPLTLAGEHDDFVRVVRVPSTWTVIAKPQAAPGGENV